MTKRLFAAILAVFIMTVCALPVSASGSDVLSASGSDAPAQELFGSSEQTVTQILDGNYLSRVLEITADETTELGEEYGYSSRLQQLKVEVMRGPEKGKTAYVIYDLTDTWGGNSGSKPAKVGDKVIVQLEQSADGLLTGYVTSTLPANFEAEVIANNTGLTAENVIGY